MKIKNTKISVTNKPAINGLFISRGLLIMNTKKNKNNAVIIFEEMHMLKYSLSSIFISAWDNTLLREGKKDRKTSLIQ